MLWPALAVLKGGAGGDQRQACAGHDGSGGGIAQLKLLGAVRVGKVDIVGNRRTKARQTLGLGLAAALAGEGLDAGLGLGGRKRHDALVPVVAQRRGLLADPGSAADGADVAGVAVFGAGGRDDGWDVVVLMVCNGVEDGPIAGLGLIVPIKGQRAAA